MHNLGSTTLLTAEQVALRLGFLSSNEFPNTQKLRYAVRRGLVPAPIKLPGGRGVRWLLVDLIEWESQLKAVVPSALQPRPLGSGRPTKAELHRRQRAALAVAVGELRSSKQ